MNDNISVYRVAFTTVFRDDGQSNDMFTSIEVVSYDVVRCHSIVDTIIVEVPHISLSTDNLSSSERCRRTITYRVSGKFSNRDVEYSDIVEYHLTFTTVFRHYHQTDGVVTDVEAVSQDIFIR